MRANRHVVLILMGAFWPGSDSAGPAQSLRGLCTGLAADFDFRIVARDRPFGAASRTAPLEPWTDLGFARVSYLVARRFGASGLRELLRRTPHDVLMMNGFFDREFTLPTVLMRRAGLIPAKPTFLSPRGEFGQGALSLKATAKTAWLTGVRAGRLLDGVTLHATSIAEAADIVSRMPFVAPPVVAPNVRGLFERPPSVPAGPNDPLRLAFVGRITPVKNIDYAIKVLATVKVPVRFDLFGPLSDETYARSCHALSASLPPHIQVRFMGEVANDSVPQILAAYDLMFMPTLGENFGHAIFEALGAGTPVLISNRTPWRGLELREAGFDLPLESPAAFGAAIHRFARLTAAQRRHWRDQARAEAERAIMSADAAARSRDMLNAALSRTG